KETIGCRFFNFLTAVDWKEQGLEVVARVDNLDEGASLFLKTKLGPGVNNCASLTPVYLGANWMERECFDMFGINFDNHPDLHRLHAKRSWTLTYAQYPSIASKTDYVGAMTSEFAYVMAAEEIGKIEVPKRAQYLRVIVAELQRIASHLLWLGTWCMDMGGALGGGATIFLYCIREREDILDLFESLVGARLLYGFFQVGGTRYDIPDGWAEQCRTTIDRIESRIDEYEQMLEDNAFFLARTQ